MDVHKIRCAGGVVLGDHGTIALVRNQKATKWFFPKGKLDANESDEDAARREIQEEAGLTNLELIDDLGTYERPRINKDGTPNLAEVKVIHMYLFVAPMHASVTPSMEIEEACWMPVQNVIENLENIQDRAWFVSVFERVRQAIQRD